MINALKIDMELILEQVRNITHNIFNIVEVGCGSGQISATLLKMIKEFIIKLGHIQNFCLDVNNEALNLN